MGDMADWALEQAGEEWFFDNRQRKSLKPLIKRGIWQCNDGREIPIVDMTDSHLVNTIHWLGRNWEKQKRRHKYRKLLAREYARRNPAL